MFKVEWQVEGHPGLYLTNNNNGPRTSVPKTKVVQSLPDEELTDIQEIDKDPRDGDQLVWRDAEKNMT